MKQDETARAIHDLTKRVQELEAVNAMRARAEFRRPSPVLMADREHPGASLGIGTHRVLGEPLEDDGA